jgi:hypothetical protein
MYDRWRSTGPKTESLKEQGSRKQKNPRQNSGRTSDLLSTERVYPTCKVTYSDNLSRTFLRISTRIANDQQPTKAHPVQS